MKRNLTAILTSIVFLTGITSIFAENPYLIQLTHATKVSSIKTSQKCDEHGEKLIQQDAGNGTFWYKGQCYNF